MNHRMFAVCAATLMSALGLTVASAPLHARQATPRDLLAGSRQLVLVVTPDWDAVKGELRRFERRTPGDPWTPAGGPVEIVVGQKGTAWDAGLDAVWPGPRKAEGDGKSPAGVFPLGHAFGFAPGAEVSWLKLPYIPVDEATECVDDAASKHYNRIVDRRTVKSPDWTSSEKMRAIGEPYRWGVVVNYNSAPVVPRRGSCIFLHIGGGPDGKGTAGCTAMPSPDLRTVMEWLDASTSPVLVQLPRAAYLELRATWQLP